MAKKRLIQKRNKEERRIKEENFTDKLFLLHLKKSLYVIIVWVISMIIHNLILKFAGLDEELFSTLAVYIIPIYLLISIIYTLSKHKRIEGKR